MPDAHITIAGITLRVDIESARQNAEPFPGGLRLIADYERFLAADSDLPAINFVFSDLTVLPGSDYKYRFLSAGLWNLYYNDRNEFRIEFKKGADGVPLAFIDADLNKRTCTIIYTEDGRKDTEKRLLPFVYPVDEVLFINLLPSFNGIIVHACGIDDSGKGLIFTGVSGAGKSTTARLWSDEPGIKILSDDRIIIREADNKLYAYGTPWHGEVNVCDPGRVEIERIFFLEHSDKNYAKPLSAVDAATRMFVRCFPTFWDKEGMEFTLSFIDKIVKSIPCYELGFVPDKSALSFVRGLE